MNGTGHDESGAAVWVVGMAAKALLETISRVREGEIMIFGADSEK